MTSSEEICREDLPRYTSDLREAVERVCQSPAFRTSLKSREFLGYVVDHALSGNIDLLKERLIGMSLLGRDADYDTAADACVRVRANDVRKRLIAYYKANQQTANFTVEVPAGAYVPRFFRQVAPPAFDLLPLSPPESDESPDQFWEPPESWQQAEWATPLPLQWLILPTVIALFLCTICMRWQITQEHPFTAFWQDVFQNHRPVLYLPSLSSGNGQDSISFLELKAAAPLLNLAGQFHGDLNVVSTQAPPSSAGDMLFAIGDDSPRPPAGQSDNNRLTVQETPRGREVVDRDTSDAHLSIAGRAALLTIVNGPRRSMRIEGTDDAAIGSVVTMLCERTSFPEGLVDSFQPGTVVQVVFPLTPRAEAIILREPLQWEQATMDRLLP